VNGQRPRDALRCGTSGPGERLVMREMAILVPSRNRPNAIAELAIAFDETSGFDVADLIVRIDDDDPRRGEYLALPALNNNLGEVFRNDRMKILIGPRERLGPSLNSLAREFHTAYRTLGFMGDDHRPRTQDWARYFALTLRELGTGFVYGDDKFQSERLPTHVVMTSDIVATLGYFCPPGLIHMYLDNSWLALGQGIERITYMPTVVIEHMHPLIGKAQWDDGYREVNASSMFDHDGTRYTEWMEDGYAKDVAALDAMIGARK
jgi:hypothetical protein